MLKISGGNVAGLMHDVSAIALDRPVPTEAGADAPTAAALAIGAIVAALAGFLAILATGHLDEDAYILFIRMRDTSERGGEWVGSDSSPC